MHGAATFPRGHADASTFPLLDARLLQSCKSLLAPLFALAIHGSAKSWSARRETSPIRAPSVRISSEDARSSDVHRAGVWKIRGARRAGANLEPSERFFTDGKTRTSREGNVAATCIRPTRPHVTERTIEDTIVAGVRPSEFTPRRGRLREDELRRGHRAR